jgi:hypothetical protein
MSNEPEGLIERAAALVRRPGSSRPESRVGSDRPRSHNAPGLPAVGEARKAYDLAGASPFVEIPYSQSPVNTPPVLGVHDAAIVARLAAMTVMAVRWRVTEEEAFVTAMQRLHDLNIPVNGVILSRVNLRKYARYGAPDEDALAPSLRRYHAS